MMNTAFVSTSPILRRASAVPRRVCDASNRLAPLPIRRSKLRQSPKCCADTTPKAAQTAPKFSLQALLLVVSVSLWSLLFFPLAMLLSLFRRHKQLVQLSMLTLSLALKTSRIKVSINNPKSIPKEPCLIVSNHQSPLDIFIVACLKKPLVSILPRRITNFPFIGWILRLANWIFLEGQDRRSQMNAMGKVQEHLKTDSVAVFPEGKPKEDGVMGRFASPIFRAARKAGVDILPVTVSGSNELCDGVMPVRGGKVDVTVHPVVKIQDDMTDKQLAEATAGTIRSALPGVA